MKKSRPKRAFTPEYVYVSVGIEDIHEDFDHDCAHLSNRDFNQVNYSIVENTKCSE